MSSLNRYNIYKSSSIAAAGFAVLTFFGFLALTGRLELTQQGQEFLKVILIYGIVPAMLLTSVFALLTRLTRPPHPKKIEKSALEKADELLKEIAQSKAGACLTNSSAGVVRVAELAKVCEHPLSHTWAGRLEELHEQVPAYLLPGKFGDTNGPLLDWYKYDLCIIAAREDVGFAKAISRKLSQSRSDMRLRVYVDETGGMLGVEQQRFIRSVFYGGSWNCLALMSIHTIHDPRKRSELNQAMQRAQRLESHTYRNYLIPIAVDRHGLDYMMTKDTYLKRYVENLRVITDRKRLFDEIVSILLNRWPPVVPTPPDPVQESPKRFAVALSFPGEHRSFVKAVVNELKQSLSGKHVFFDEDYTHELARPDMDTYLQTIYLEQSKLVVVFLCAEYADKQWCGLEWRAVRELIKKKQSDTIMPIRFDDTHIPGLFSIDGYVNAELNTPEEIADLITRRLSMM